MTRIKTKLSLLFLLPLTFSKAHSGYQTKPSPLFESRYQKVVEQWGAPKRDCQDSLKKFTSEKLKDFKLERACEYVRKKGYVFSAIVDGEPIEYSFRRSEENSCFETLATHVEIYSQFTEGYNIYRTCSTIPGEGNSLVIFQALRKQ